MDRSNTCELLAVTKAKDEYGVIRETMFAWDYQGEPMLRYSGKTYSIYRTYVSKTDEIELYVERKGGTNGKGESV